MMAAVAAAASAAMAAKPPVILGRMGSPVRWATLPILGALPVLTVTKRTPTWQSSVRSRGRGARRGEELELHLPAEIPSSAVGVRSVLLTLTFPGPGS